jgi:dihydroflavonol-4-reductase
MSVVVTGASGHVGANLIRTLLSQGRSVRALVHVDRRALKGLDVEIVEGDIRDPNSLYATFKGAEVVYHLAANISLMMSDWQRLREVNVVGTRNVVDACIRCGVKRLVHMSSIHALEAQGSTDRIIDESCQLVDSRNCPPYDRSKANGEREVYEGIKRGLDAVVIIPTGIIGPYDFGPSHFGQVLLALANGRLPALVAGGFYWVDVRDVVGGAIRAEQIAPTGSRYILSGHWVSLPEIARLVQELTGKASPRFVSPLWLTRFGAPFITGFDLIRGRQPLYTSASMRALRTSKKISHDKATRELGYRPRAFDETITDTLTWFNDAGLVNHMTKLTSGTT